MMEACPAEPAGRKKLQNSAARQMTAVKVMEPMIAIDSRRPGSDSMRTRRRVRPRSARRDMNE